MAAYEMLRRFKAESAALDTKPDLSFPMPLGERSIPHGSMLLVALILALCGYGTWYYLATGERSPPERVSEVPDVLLPPAVEHLTGGSTAPSVGQLRCVHYYITQGFGNSLAAVSLWANQNCS